MRLFNLLTMLVVASLLWPSLGSAQSRTLAERIEALERAQGGGGSSAGGGGEVMVQLLDRLDQLQKEVQSLRSVVEEQNFEIDNLKRRQRDQYLDIDQRIERIAGGGNNSGFNSSGFAQNPSQTQGQATGQVPNQRVGANGGFNQNTVRNNPPRLGSTNATGGGARTQPLNNNGSTPTLTVTPDPAPANLGVPEVRQGTGNASTTAGLGQSQPVFNLPVQDPEAEREAYNSAFALLKNGQYADSADAFQSFLQRYPTGEFADNAQYWLGESYYVTRNYQIAQGAFELLLQRYPDSAKLPDAKLKLGFTHYELQNWADSRRILEDVLNSHPGTTVARLAERRLRALRLEGR